MTKNITYGASSWKEKSRVEQREREREREHIFTQMYNTVLRGSDLYFVLVLNIAYSIMYL